METVEQLEKELEKTNLAIHSDPKSSYNYCLRGVILYKLKRFEEAIENYDQAIKIEPEFFEAYSNRGVALKTLGKLNEALIDYDKAISINVDYAEAYSNKGVALCKMNMHKQALECCEKAIELKPRYGGAFYNRGIALQGLHRMQEALESYKKAVEIEPNNAAAYCDMGVVFHALGNIEASISHYDQAIAIDGAFSRAYWNKANSMLLLGNYKDGLPLYEWRWVPELTTSTVRNFSQPLWLGLEDLKGKTILLHCEQGAGDSIQCIRYAKWVGDLAAKVIVEAPKSLVRLFMSVEGVDEIVEAGKQLPDFDFHCPLMSLPLAFNSSPKDVPNKVPYLLKDASLEDQWKTRLGDKKKKRVGLAWRGSRTHGNDRQRSLAFASFVNCLPNDFEYISLQKEVREEDVASLKQSQVRCFENDISDFADTAALCALMDLVITVDTSVAHLAGALGQQTWLLLPHVPDWRWMLSRDDTPWYPTVKLLRQNEQKNWDSVIKQVSHGLSAFHSVESALGFDADVSVAENKVQTLPQRAPFHLACTYINLDDRQDRKITIEETFSKHMSAGWHLTRFPAFNQQHEKVKAAAGKIRDSEKGCFLSHRSIIQNHLNSFEPIMVLEDDALFGEKSFKFIENFFQQWSPHHDWDVVFTDVAIVQPEKMLELFNVKKKMTASHQCRVIDLKGYVFAGATSYLLSASGIQKLNDIFKSYASLDEPYDLFLRNLIWTGKLKGFMLFPFVTTLSGQAEKSQIQLAETALTDLVWNTYRRMMWIGANVDDFSQEAKTIKDALFDKNSELLSVILAATTSSKFVSK
jgi:tetratricopeptide (TPR) repeat protein/GR25 family glycosyltransferase involved in LPS biosynthesis